MYKTSLLIAFSLVLFSCKETEFSSGLENRVIAIIDMAPETYSAKVDFKSDDQVGGCSDHETAYIDQWLDGSTDNVYYSIRIEAKDYFKSENNCNEYNLYDTSQEQIQHKLTITAYVNEVNNQMYIAGSHFSDHPGYPSNVISAYYKLERDENGDDNSGLGIEYFGYDAELEVSDLDLANGTLSGTFSATLYRGTPAPDTFMGVDNITNLDLYNPLLDDLLGDIDGDGLGDYHLTDSIRIENCVFQRINVINNVP